MRKKKLANWESASLHLEDVSGFSRYTRDYLDNHVVFIAKANRRQVRRKICACFSCAIFFILQSWKAAMTPDAVGQWFSPALAFVLGLTPVLFCMFNPTVILGKGNKRFWCAKHVKDELRKRHGYDFYASHFLTACPSGLEGCKSHRSRSCGGWTCAHVHSTIEEGLNKNLINQ